MNLKDQLNIIAALIMTKIVVLIASRFLIPGVMFDNYFYFFYTLCDIILVVYLYKFIKIDKKLHLSVVPIVMIVVALLYLSAGRFIQIMDADRNTQEGMMDQMLYAFIPSLIIVSGELMLGILLIKNTAEDGSAGAIRLVGYSYLAVLGLSIIAMIVSAFGFWGILSILNLMSALVPLFAMQYMYRQELKRMNAVS